MKLLLGSQSPRRKEILSHFSLPTIQQSPVFDEESIPFTGNLEEYVCKIAEGKAESLVEEHPDTLILTADSIVYREGKVYGKPKDLNEAKQFLSELVGNWHSVWSGVTIRKGNEIQSQAEETRVLFNPLTDQQIDNYLSTFNWSDKAGGYGIQVCGGLIVNRIEGCFYNVMGLPINTVYQLLKKYHLELWDYLK